MDTDKEKEFLKQQEEWDKNSVAFFSNKKKPEREKSVVENFLMVLGINYNRNEIQAGKDEPVDIIFRDGRFQILECMDSNRKRHKEYKERYQRSKNAKGIKDYIEPYRSNPPITSSELVKLITDRLTDKKVTKYSLADKKKLDALVDVNLKNRSGYKASSDTIDISALTSQGWRSVSFVMGLHAGVLSCQDTAPDFLRELSKIGIKLADNPVDIWNS